MTNSGGGGGRGGCSCCRYCFRLIFSLGVMSLFLWLSLRTSKPKITLDQFYVPSLDRALNSTTNTTLAFELKLKNTNAAKGVYYDNVSVMFFDSLNKSRSIGNFTIPSFYQGHKKTAEKRGSVETNRLDQAGLLQANGSAGFRVDLATSVRFEIVFWKTKRKKILVGADVQVNDQGTKVHSKGIELTSDGFKLVAGGYFGALLANLLFVALLGWLVEIS